jgi:hypothetical protein
MKVSSMAVFSESHGLVQTNASRETAGRQISNHGTFVFRVAGPGGGEWYLNVAPDASTSGEGAVAHPGLAIHMRDTDVFCRMLTSRLNLPVSLITGALGLRGDLRLFLRMNTLLSVDARPPDAAQQPSCPASVAQTGD